MVLSTQPPGFLSAMGHNKPVGLKRLLISITLILFTNTSSLFSSFTTISRNGEPKALLVDAC